LKEWEEEPLNEKPRRLHLYKTATRINMKDGRLTVEQYLSKSQE
jgi:hypothetical protein